MRAKLACYREVKRLYLTGKYTQSMIAAIVGNGIGQSDVSRFLRNEGLTAPSRADILAAARKKAKDQPIEVRDPVLETVRRWPPAKRRAVWTAANEVKAVLTGRHGRAAGKLK